MMMMMEGSKMSKREYDLKAIMYSAYDTPQPRLPPHNAGRPMHQFKCPLVGELGHPCSILFFSWGGKPATGGRGHRPWHNIIFVIWINICKSFRINMLFNIFSDDRDSLSGRSITYSGFNTTNTNTTLATFSKALTRCFNVIIWQRSAQLYGIYGTSKSHIICAYTSLVNSVLNTKTCGLFSADISVSKPHINMLKRRILLCMNS